MIRGAPLTSWRVVLRPMRFRCINTDMATRWNIAVSPETDRSVRMYLAEQGRGKKGELSRFIEDAVRDTMFRRTVAEIKAANANVPQAELEAAIDEALEWARAQ